MRSRSRFAARSLSILFPIVAAPAAAGLLGALLCAPALAQPAAADTLDEVVTVSSRIERPRREIGTSVSILTGEEIRERGYASVMDALRTQTAIGVSNPGGAGKVSALRIRGEEGYRTLIRIDGVEISDPSRTQVGPAVEHLIATNDIERVEILRGPQGFVYGADSGGVVDIRSRRGTGELSGGVGVELGDYATQRLDADVSAGGDRGDFSFSITDLSSDGFNARKSDAVLADEDGYDNTTAHARLGWNANDRLRLELVAHDVDARYEFDQCGFPVTHDCVGELDQQTLRLAASLGADAFTHLVAYSSSDTGRSNFAAGAGEFSTAGRLERLEYTGSFAGPGGTTLVYGADLERERVEPFGGVRLQDRQDAYYFEYQGAFAEGLYFTLGARRDRNDDFGAHTSVRASFAYVDALADGAALKYRASFGSGFRAPSLSEIAYNAGPFAAPPASQLTLVEETSTGYDVGIELATGRGGVYEITYFDQEIDDEIYFDLAAFSGYLQSPGRSDSHGVEISARLPVGRRWQLFGNATFNATATVDGLARIRRPERMGNLGFRYAGSAERLRITGNVRYSGRAFDEIFGIGRVVLEPYTVVDMSLTYAASARTELFARIENLLDERFEEASGFNSTSAALYGGVRLRF